MVNLKDINLGDFLNNDICELIAIYLKQLVKIKISSKFINDNTFKKILINCKDINEIDLEGCDKISGICFLEINNDQFPKKLGKITFSNDNKNFDNVFNFLNNKRKKVKYA